LKAGWKAGECLGKNERAGEQKRGAIGAKQAARGPKKLQKRGKMA
jgi:hypothetical protein